MSTTTEQDWIRTDRSLPPDNKVVLTMDSGGHVQELIRDGRLWWFKDRSMYVYYVPTFWKEAP